jgi:glycosyltransferase involved in cell wall biosynthesis
MDKKNILFVSDPGTVGGAARSLEEVVIEEKKLGYNPIVCTSVYNDYNVELENRGIKTLAIGHCSAMNPKSPYKWKRPLKFPYELTKYYLSLPKSIKIIEENIDLQNIDVIHTNSSRNDVGCFLNKKYKIPHVMHIREFGKEDFNCDVYRPNYYRFISQYSNKLLAISKAVANSWIEKGVDKNKMQILYDGVDINSICYDEKHDFNKRKIKIIMSGGICEPKGQHIAIKAISQLPLEIKNNVTLDIAGWSDPRYEKMLYKMVKEYCLEEIINFIGVRTDLYEILKDYDIGLTCSKSEGFGRVTAEYLYAGLGVIGSNTGATPELIKNGNTGLIFNYPDSKDLANCIQYYFENRNQLAFFAKNAHEDAKKFSAERNAIDIVNVYKEICVKE